MDNVLNAYPGAFSAGEARYLWFRGIVAKRDCGCGKPLPQCGLWRDIRSAAFGDDPPDPRRVIEL